jgi:hypothetical protein
VLSPLGRPSPPTHARLISHPMLGMARPVMSASVSARICPAVLAQVLVQCAESCERALIDYRKVAGGMVTGHELSGDLLRAIAR